MRRLNSAGLVAAGMLIAGGCLFCARAARSTSRSAVSSPRIHRYDLAVEGARGGQLTMLLITKPAPTGGPRRRLETVTLPFSTTFSAASCYAWLDTAPGGPAAADDSRFTVTLKRDGTPASACEGEFKPDRKQSCGLGDL